MTLAGDRGSRKRARNPAVASLLAWYDRHRRNLPWRTPPGKRQDPYRVWLSEIMLQQTTVKAVTPYYARFVARWPTVHDLAAAPLAQILGAWAGLGYYARARNLHACARAVVAEHGGNFPESEDALRALPGIGAYTAAAMAAIAYDRKATPIDGNIERVVARLFAVADALPAAKPRIRAFAQTLTPARRPGDFAQALMDLGATLCSPKRPACGACPWSNACEAHLRGNPEAFPRKARKPQRALRRGAAFVVLRAGSVLLRTRPSKGLLGGMSEVPTTEWKHDFDDKGALAAAPQFSPLPAGERPARAARRVREKQQKIFARSVPPHPNPLPTQVGPARLAHENAEPGQARVPWEREIRWRRMSGVVTHTFTHFPLELVVYRGKAAKGTKAPRGARWVPLGRLAGEALPNVMRKVIAHAVDTKAAIRERHAP